MENSFLNIYFSRLFAKGAKKDSYFLHHEKYRNSIFYIQKSALKPLCVKIAFLALVLFSTSEIIHAQSPDSLFREANELYKNSAYEGAIALYGKIDSIGYVSSDLYYNTANAYFRSNKLGKARLFYERALKLDPSDEDIRKNLNYTITFLSDRFEEVPVLFFVRWYQDLVNLLSSNSWFRLSILLFLISLGFSILFIYLNRTSLRRIFFYSAAIVAVLSVFSLFLSFQQSRDSNAAIVLSPAVNVKSAPRTSGKDLFILHEGAKLWVSGELEDWKEIRISDGRKGWIPAGNIEVI